MAKKKLTGLINASVHIGSLIERTEQRRES